ncbi:MAG: hypothetical protein QOH06_4126 [Acidobacteriota bacterium]|jgi:hypothetical protein|nr:hypothetical protein [Acidobacteriota bacterium]
MGHDTQTAEELIRYCDRAFDFQALGPGTRLPLPDEPFVAVWERWAAEAQDGARNRGAFAVLREHLPQLHFPIREGISQSEDYRAATLRGVPPEELAGATGLELERPDLVELDIHPSPAGRIPVLLVRGRAEFVALVRALGRRNEPSPVPDSQGALMVSGFNNWARIRELLRKGEQMEEILPRKELYQDSFILLSDGPYSAVPAADLGLGEEEWKEISLAIRRDHECAHYFTRRLFGSMRNHAQDELMADWAGLAAAAGRFRADWFLRFLGLEDYPLYRPGGRLDIYRGDPPLSDEAFRALWTLIRSAALNLESFDVRPGLEARALMLAALASLRLDELASPAGEALLRAALESIRARLGWP